MLTPSRGRCLRILFCALLCSIWSLPAFAGGADPTSKSLILARITIADGTFDVTMVEGSPTVVTLGQAKLRPLVLVPTLTIGDEIDSVRIQVLPLALDRPERERHLPSEITIPRSGASFLPAEALVMIEIVEVRKHLELKASGPAPVDEGDGFDRENCCVATAYGEVCSCGVGAGSSSCCVSPCCENLY